VRTKVLWIISVLLLLPLPLVAQRNSAAVTGHVYDPSGAPIPGATITAKQTATGTTSKTTSNAIGLYQFPFLIPGNYEFTVSKQGFDQYIQKGITLSVEQRATLDFKLKIGQVTQTVQVTANAPLLETTSGENSWTISSERVAAIPVRNLNTIMSTWFAPGVTVTSGARNLRPFDTSGSQHEGIAGGLSESGGSGGQPGEAGGSANLVLVDGVSANTHAVGVGYNPISDTVQEVHVQSTMYDAQYGWTTGGVINTITKGGTNTWHGHAYEYVQNTLLNAATWQENFTGVPKGAWHQNYYGGSVGGPILKNKLLFFFAYQKIKQVQPDYFSSSVPTPAEKNGDFSDVRNSGGTLQTIYDPLTTTCSGGTCIRTAFQGNLIPSGRMNSVATAVLGYIPDPPANAGDPNTHLTNWFPTPRQRKFIDDFPEYDGRLDYNISDKTHMFFRYGWNSLAETRSYKYSFNGEPYNLAETSSNSPFGRQNDDFTLQVTHTFNPTTVLQVRTGLDRFRSISGSSISAGFDVTSLNFSPTFIGQASRWFPKFNWSDYEGAGANPLGISPSDLTISNEVVLAKIYNQHNMKFGFQNMEVGENVEQPGYSAGNFSFNGSFTTANPLALSSATGNSIADFLLGYPSSGFIQVSSAPALMMHLWSAFAQDDIHVSSRLTLTAGVRWAYQGPLTDRFNALTRGFCETCASPIQVPGMNLQGGLQFAGVGSTPRGITNPRHGNIAPRFSFAYRFGSNMVVRGGYGIIYAQAWQNPGAAPGFSQTTNLLTPVQEGIPATITTDPFPNGILTPVGSSGGLATAIGQGIHFTDPDTNIPRIQQYSLSVQRQLGQNWLASVTYVGSYMTRLPVSRNLNYLPLPALALGASTLTSTVPNPLYQAQFQPQNAPYLDLLNGTYLNASTVKFQQLLVPYPQFPINGVTENFIPIGKNKYNGLWMDMEKRMSHGLDFDVNFVWSKTMQDVTFLNPTDPAPSWFLSPYDAPEQIKFSGVWQLPFGPGREFANGTNPFVSRIVGGWSVSGVSRWQAGFPIPFPRGVAPTGNSVKTSDQSLRRWFNTCTQLANGSTTNCLSGEQPAWVILNPFQLMEWSPYLPNLRGPSSFQTDISAAKDTTIKERYRLQFRADFTNAFNHPDWAYTSVNNVATSGTFGQYAPFNNQSNNPRVIMLSLQLFF
jgi:Carboxypeptidase regulatory-like domain/TonB dependent receptor-like, beta-barrel